MTELFAILAFAINVVIVFYVVRRATRSDEQVMLLKQLVASVQKPAEKSAIAQLTEERRLRGK